MRRCAGADSQPARDARQELARPRQLTAESSSSRKCSMRIPVPPEVTTAWYLKHVTVGLARCRAALLRTGENPGATRTSRGRCDGLMVTR